MTETWFNIIFTLFTTIIFFVPLNIFIDIKKKKLYSIINFFVTYIVSYISITTYKQLGMLLLFFSCSIYIYSITRNINYSILIYIFTAFSLSVSDALVGFVFMVLFNTSYSELMSNNIIKLIINFPILLVSTIICVYIKKVLNRIHKLYPNLLLIKGTKKLFRLIFYVVILLFIAFYMIFSLYSNNCFYPISFNIYVYALSIFIICVILIAISYILVNIISLSNKQEFVDKENQQLKEYTNMLENMSTDLRRFKHDYVNILYTLGEFINEEDIQGLKEFYNTELLPESNKIVNRDKYVSLLRNIKIMPLKALISSKILFAQSHGIDTHIEIFEEIDEISIKTIDICRIVGIFLDNAIEAACLCSKKFIHLAAIKNDENVIIVILNSCSDDCPPVYKLYKKNFSTKGKNHGIGLKFVKELIDTSYKNILLNTSVSNGVFKQELIINKNVLSE